MSGLAARAWPLCKRAISLALLVAVIAVVAVFAALAVPQLVGAEQSYVVLSGSMEPTMEAGDVILVDAVEVEAVEGGDIVTYREGPGVTTHRVVEVVRDGEQPRLRTQGDANAEPDPGLVTGDQLVGRVMTVGGSPVVIPYVGHAVETARTRLGVYALVFVPFTLLVLNEVYTRLAASRRRAESERGSGPTPDPLGTPHAFAEGVAVAAEPVSAETNTNTARRAQSAGTTASVDGLDPRVFRLTPMILAVMVAYGAWTTVRYGSPVSATVTGGSVVALLLLGAGRLHIRRRNTDLPPPPDGLAAADATAALLALLIAVPLAAWLTLTHEAILSGMLAAGGAVGIVLLTYIRLRLWWVGRRTPAGVDPLVDDTGVSGS